MGSTEHEGGGGYTFSPNLSLNNKRSMLVGRFEDGRIMGKFIHQATRNSTLAATAQVTPDSAMASAEASYSGSDFTTTGKFELPGCVELTYMQGIMERAGLGVQLLHIPFPAGALTGYSMAFRCWSRSTIMKQPQQQQVSRWIFSANMGSMNPLHLTYTWYTPYKADFSTEFGVSHQQDGSMGSHYAVGASFEYNTARVKVRLDHRLRVGVYTESILTPAIRGFLSGELDHLNNKYRFGIGLSFQ